MKISVHTDVEQEPLRFSALEITLNILSLSVFGPRVAFVHLQEGAVASVFCSVHFSLPLSLHPSLRLPPSICSAESCDQEKVYTSPLHLPRDATVGEGRKGDEGSDWKAAFRSLSLSPLTPS